MNYIKLKIFVGFMLIYLIDRIYCEKNTLEDKYETGRENLWSISIHHDNITSFFEKIDGEYNHLSDLFKDQNINGIDDFIELSKKQTVMEVNNLAQDLNKFSLEEQSKYDLVFRTHIETFNKNIPLFINCLKNYNSFKKSLRCIDQHQNSQNKTEHEHYGNIKNLLDTYNSVLIPEVKDVESNFITAANKILSHAKNNSNELIKRKSSIIMLSTSPTNKDDLNTKQSIFGEVVNNTLKNIYIDQKNILSTAHLENFISIQSMSLNVTLNRISRVNNIYNHDKKNFQCCFDYSQIELDKAKIIAVNDSNECVQVGMSDLKNLVSLQSKEARKYFSSCFHYKAQPEDIFECMEWLQSSKYASNILKLTYEEAVNKFNKNQEVLSGKIFNCLYKWRHSFDQQLKNLNNRFDNCIQIQKSYEKCIEPTIIYNYYE